MVVQSTAQPIRATPQVRQLNLFALSPNCPARFMPVSADTSTIFASSTKAPDSMLYKHFGGNSPDHPEPIKTGRHCDRSTRADPGYALGTARGIVTLCSWAICGFYMWLPCLPSRNPFRIYQSLFDGPSDYPVATCLYPR